jgi:UDP-GlcNAc:undecaprenyl-phosphate GlcNAc-1-phosphate transferase
MRPSKKLWAQLLAASLPVLFSDIRIASLQGIAGIEELPYWVSVGGTIFLCTFFINVFNFMDGIDGLACTLAILYTGVLGAMFAASGATNMACISFSLTGATMGLLYFNRAPARIYMGDTGSMLLGFMIFTLSAIYLRIVGYDIKFSGLEKSNHHLLVLISLVFIPIFDALRVFVLRASKGISPLRADRTHLHYYLLDAGFSHSGAVAVIAIANVVLTGIVWLLQPMPPIVLLGIMVVFTSALVMRIAAMRKAAMTHTDIK